MTLVTEDRPLISIVTVCYNAGETIERTFRGIVDQTYPNIEYIVVDGGSTDATLAIAAKYSHVISQLVTEKDDGIYDAMNKGIRLARGNIIGIINADDYYASGVLELVASVWRSRSDIDVISGICLIVDSNGVVVSTKKPSVDMLLREVNIPHPSTFVSRLCYERHGYYDSNYTYGGDYEFFCRLAKLDASFCFVDDVFAYFRLGGFSSTVGILREKEFVLTALRHWGPLEAMKVFCREFLFSYCRRMLGRSLRKIGLMK